MLVDPLDGTREFLAGRDEFTVNIAIVFDGSPRIGLIAAPALGLVWRGVVGRGAERLRLAPGAEPELASEIRAVRTRPHPAAGFVATVSRSHFDERTDAFLQQLPIAAQVSCGSSLKFCRIAEGSVDLYARLAQTCELDAARNTYVDHSFSRAADRNNTCLWGIAGPPVFPSSVPDRLDTLML